MTNNIFGHGSSFIQYPHHALRKVKDLFTIRCIPILGIACLTIQFILLTIYGHLGCGSETCDVETNKDSSFFRIFLGRFYKETVPVLPSCPPEPPDLEGYIKPTTEVLTWAELEYNYLNLQMGGRYKPLNCTSRHRVAIIVPFRDRDIHLKIFLNNIHPILKRQQLDYGVYIVDLDPAVSFNRALLLNVGFLESLKIYDYQCFIFHDVDLLPENDNIMYTCPDSPRHMSVAIDRMGYKLPYDKIFGGVTAMTKEQFYKVNGYSNRYFGWGGEDDDMFNRINATNQTITRYPKDIARYTMLPHVRQQENLARFDILKSGKITFHRDGINTLVYHRLTLDFRRLFTYILVTVNQTAIESGRGIRYNHDFTKS